MSGEIGQRLRYEPRLLHVAEGDVASAAKYATNATGGVVVVSMRSLRSGLKRSLANRAGVALVREHGRVLLWRQSVPLLQRIRAALTGIPFRPEFAVSVFALFVAAVLLIRSALRFPWVCIPPVRLPLFATRLANRLASIGARTAIRGKCGDGLDGDALGTPPLARPEPIVQAGIPLIMSGWHTANISKLSCLFHAPTWSPV